MRVANYFNTDIRQLEAKNFNILVGVSLGNKYFTHDSIKDFLLWSLANTKERVAVLIPDKIHSINYQVRNGYTEERANQLASREGEKVKEVIQNILEEFRSEDSNLVTILKWQEIETSSYKLKTTILIKRFTEDKKFRDLILAIVKESVHAERTLSEFDYEKLALYPIAELPLLVSGLEHDGILYDLLPYPGISKIDHLAVDLQRGKTFPEISKALGTETKLNIIEAYAEM